MFVRVTSPPRSSRPWWSPSAWRPCVAPSRLFAGPACCGGGASGRRPFPPRV